MCNRCGGDPAANARTPPCSLWEQRGPSSGGGRGWHSGARDSASEWDPCSPQDPGSWSTEARRGMSTASCAAAVSSRWAPVPLCPTRVLTTACPAMRTSLLLAAPAAARWGLGRRGGGAELHCTRGWGEQGSVVGSESPLPLLTDAAPQTLTQGGVTYRDQPWHRECLVCTGCQTPLAGQQFTSRDDDPYCVACFGELFAPKCSSCKRPITGGTKGQRTEWVECRQGNGTWYWVRPRDRTAHPPDHRANLQPPSRTR